MITFVIPDLFAAISQFRNERDFCFLIKMLDKATLVSLSDVDSSYELIERVFHVSNSGVVPVAAIEQASSIKSDDWSCVASPVMITPNRDHLDMTQVSGFDLSLEEAEGFCDEFNDYFNDDGFSFRFENPNRWYCHFETGFDVSEVSPTSALNRDIAQHIPQGKAGVSWRKIFHESQMLLHHSATNRQRSVAGKSEINSLWFWGGGKQQSTYQKQDFNVFTDQLFSKELGLLSGCVVKPLSAYLTDCDDGEHNVIVDGITEEWKKWDSHYFEPALTKLKQNKIQEIVLYIDLERKFTLKKNDFYRFWKNNKVFN